MNDSWENSPDAARSIGHPPVRAEARVLLVFGDFAEVVTMYHPHDDPLRVPAVALAEQLGIERQDLPGRRFTAAIVDDQVSDAELIS